MTIDSFRNEFRFLSNFYPATIELEGIIFPSVEHAYQAAKTENVEARRKIAAIKRPDFAKSAGRRLKVRQGWEKIKFNIMLDLIRKKFQHSRLKEMLLATDDAELIEGNTWGDTVWGMCNGKGENALGKILMKVREELR